MESEFERIKRGKGREEEKDERITLYLDLTIPWFVDFQQVLEFQCESLCLSVERDGELGKMRISLVCSLSDHIRLRGSRMKLTLF